MKIPWAHVDCNPLPAQIQQDTIIQAEISGGEKKNPFEMFLRQKIINIFHWGGGS